ncbi:TIGR04086 family membrane protein [Dorea sp. OM07-5]|uniref:TIGR04086 family membrane protein n=1 Tax=Dorea sp. OM07-5 TaxID=2293100 RepID=UPI000E4B6A53|nr:TIGR04086 family membrane protein [Dorea sp. OM07-5]RHU94344.1 TIGR04086 family membrane protein [Dorea sp. OM07-5]
MNRLEKNQKIIWLLKALLFSYVVTGISLLLLSVLLYKFEWNEHLVSAVIVAVYVLSTVVGGIVIGKLVRTRRFFWGLLLGNLYFILLLVITIILYRSLSGNGLNMLTAWILCTGGGMTGGMIS